MAMPRVNTTADMKPGVQEGKSEHEAKSGTSIDEIMAEKSLTDADICGVSRRDQWGRAKIFFVRSLGDQQFVQT